MRILWILPYAPWPTTSGGKTRQYQLLASLARAGHRITLLAHSKMAVDDDVRDHLEPLLERLIILPRRPLRSPLTLAAALFAPYPLLASINGLAPRLESQIEALLDEPWDVIQIEHSYTFQPYEAALARRGVPFVLTEHNVESMLGAATYDRLPGWMLLFARYDQWRYRRWERRVMRQAEQVIAVTDADAQVLARIGGRPTAVVVNGVDCAYYASVRHQPQARRLLFIGNFEYAPNVDAVEWALEHVLPGLWQRFPDVRMSICGYALPQAWRERWSDSRIEWHGFVGDLREQQRQTSIFFAPLRQGGGSKLKVLEAMAAGLPIVTSGQGASGLEVNSGEHYLCAESAEDCIAAIAQLLDDPALAQRLGDAGRGYVRARHDWSVAAHALESLYAQLPAPARVAAC